MDYFETDKIMFNVKLSKYFGLYKVLDPKSVKFKGYNVYRVVFMFLICYVNVASIMLCINGLLYWRNNRNEAITYFGVMETIIFSSYKMFTIVIKSRKIREILMITRFDFLPNGSHGDESVFKLWRNRIIRITNGYAFFYFFCAILFTLSPMIFRNGMNTMKTNYGSTSKYCINIFNIYAPFSSEMYNTNFNIMYFFEASHMILVMSFQIIFDTLFITLCLIFSVHLDRVKLAFESLGLKCVTDYRITNNGDEKNKLSIHLHDDSKTYSDLICIIIKYQAILKNLDIFLSTFKHVMLLHILASSISITVLWFNLIMLYIDGKVDADTRVTIIKMIFATPSMTCQLLMTCYVIEFLHNKKESVIFALYYSNWTEMDFKCKKLILLSMYMNNAHKKKLKFSQLRIVNLELFVGTMRTCYSIVSMMLNVR